MTFLLNRPTETRDKISTLIDLLRDRALNQPEQTGYTFLQDGKEVDRLTYQELEQRVRAIAAYLQSFDISGERALLIYQPGLEYITAFFGCLYANVVAVPAYPPRRNQSISRLKAIVAASQPTIGLTTTSLLGNIEDCFAENPELFQLRWIATDNIASNLASSCQEPNLCENTLALLQFTSGSTGTPKGVMVSHGNLLHNLASIHTCYAHTPNSQGIIWLPPYHDMGLIGGVLQPLYGGFPVALMSPIDFLQKPWRWLMAISQYKATTSGGPNFAYDLCARKIKPEQLPSLDLSSWDVAFTAAEPIRPETLDRFARTFAECGFRREAFYPCYGMAETTLLVSGGLKTEPPIVRLIDGVALEQNLVVAAKDTQEGSRAIVGVGRSLLDQNVVIVDPESLTCCSASQIGEIWVLGPSVTQGYWNRPEETKQTFHAYLADTDASIAGPFLRTGDLGFIQDGELFITGRIKDLIIIRGQNRYPQDIELTVEKSHQALRPGCGAAFAVEIKGEERLVIVQEVERSYLRDLNINEIVGNINQSVVAEHNIQVYAVVLVKTGSIPKTSSGKIQRYACKVGFLNGSLNVVEDWSENPKGKAKFLHLQADIESILHKLSEV